MLILYWWLIKLYEFIFIQLKMCCLMPLAITHGKIVSHKWVEWIFLYQFYIHYHKFTLTDFTRMDNIKMLY